MARITNVSRFLGPSLYSRRPVIRATLAFDPPEKRYLEAPPAELVAALEQVLPGLEVPETTEAGFDMAALVLAAGVQIQFLSDAETAYRAVVEDGLGLHLVCSYENQNVHVHAIRMAVDLVNQFLSVSRDMAVDRFVEEARAACRSFYQQARPANWTLDYRFIVNGARARKVPVQHLMHYCVMLGQGRDRRFMLGKHSDRTSHLANRIANDKSLSNQMLKHAGLPVPVQRVVSTEQEAVEAAAAIGYPVVVKPLGGGGGEGVTADIRNDVALVRAFRRARGGGTGPIAVETMLEGEQHRFTLINGTLVAIYRQTKAQVVGDGTHTIAELVELENRDPRRLRGESGELRPIVLDEQVLDTLLNAGYEPGSVPPAGERVTVSSISNAHAGGNYERLLGRVTPHPDNLAAAVLAADTVGLDIAGVDLIIPDVTRSWKEQAGGICEINESPGLWDAVEAQIALFEYLFPPGTRPRVPLAGVMGTAARAVTDMLAHVMATSGFSVGLVNTGGCRVGDFSLKEGDAVNASLVQQMFRHPYLEAAVVQLLRDRVLNEGLGFELCDVSAVLDVAEVRSGSDGIEWAEPGEPEGLLLESAEQAVVLNGDDAACVRLGKERDPATVIVVSSQPANEPIEAHVAAGGGAVVLETDAADGWITLWRGGQKTQLLRSGELPFADDAETLRSSLFVVAMAVAMGIAEDTIVSALSDYRPDMSESPSPSVLSF